ncbi:MAG: putative oxidoreductase [Rhodobacteraceae bacterium]|nr:MAG: putative oxidoreductase [Paracoccaceae bacterium]
MDLFGRSLLALLFVAGAVQKVLAPEVAGGLLEGLGAPGWLVWPALAVNLGLAVGLLVPRTVWLAALAAASYCAVTSLFHLQPQDGWQMSIFVKNWAIAGGLLVVAAAHKPA